MLCCMACGKTAPLSWTTCLQGLTSVMAQELQSQCPTYAFSATAAEGQIVVHFCHLVGYGSINRESVRVKSISIAPVSRISAPCNQIYQGFCPQ